MNDDTKVVAKPFLTRFFEEVMNQVEVPIIAFDFKKAQEEKNNE